MYKLCNKSDKVPKECIKNQESCELFIKSNFEAEENLSDDFLSEKVSTSDVKISDKLINNMSQNPFKTKNQPKLGVESLIPNSLPKESLSKSNKSCLGATKDQTTTKPPPPKMLRELKKFRGGQKFSSQQYSSKPLSNPTKKPTLKQDITDLLKQAMKIRQNTTSSKEAKNSQPAKTSNYERHRKALKLLYSPSALEPVHNLNYSDNSCLLCMGVYLKLREESGLQVLTQAGLRGGEIGNLYRE
ncbi:unnamed protein product [Moneuplotes crassus]|uniref:Uncharacterized protein n=1 Tax=Euplotes crassus TaxID=5936 RepID=A0AAD1Y143_EUPCR|nr:unnamed protein product [Moneuplotes crassus]